MSTLEFITSSGTVDINYCTWKRAMPAYQKMCEFDSSFIDWYVIRGKTTPSDIIRWIAETLQMESALRFCKEMRR